MMNQNQVFERYGTPGDPKNLVYVNSPFPLVIAWDLNITIDRFHCHKKIKDNIEAAFDCLLHTYGLSELKRLKIDHFGGCFNYRKMRGGSKWSRHSWGIALDLFPRENGLRTKAPKAAFSKPEYDELHNIMEEHNFINYGKEKGYDWMHFEIKD